MKGPIVKLTLVSVYCGGRRVSVFMPAEYSDEGVARISASQKEVVKFAAGAHSGVTYSLGA